MAMVFFSGTRKTCTHSAGLLLLGIYYPILFTFFVAEERHQAKAGFVLSFLNDALSQATLHARATDVHLAILLFRAGRIDQMIMLMSVCFDLVFTG